MRTDRFWKKLVQAASVCAVAGMFAAPAVTEAHEEDAAVNNGKVAFSAGFDIVSEYWFRGMAQENQGFIIQPYVDVAFDLYETDDFALTGYTGIWNSFHKDDGTGDDAWFEADLYAGLGMSFDKVGLDVSYINLYNPDGGQSFAEEIDVALSYDDAGMWGEGAFAGGLQPWVLMAFEFSGGSDNGNDEGTYLEVGVAPSFALIPGETQPVTLSVPVVAGFSIDDYYEDGAGDDDSFGFLDIGLVAATPLNVPAGYGEWELTGGVHFLMLGDSTETIAGPNGFGVTDGDDFEIYGTIGVAMSY